MPTLFWPSPTTHERDKRLTESFLSLAPPTPFLIKRLYLNRASGGRLASLWKQAENKGDQNGTEAWLPDWVLLSALSDTMSSIIHWISEMWNGCRVLNHLDHAQGCNILPRGEGRKALAYQLAQENIMLFVLFSLLLVVLLVRWRRRRC